MKILQVLFIVLLISFQLSAQTKFELGAKWTYERVVRIPSMVDFVTYEIVDTATIDGLSCFEIDNVIDQNKIVATATLCIDGNRVLALDDRLQDGFQLIYDFEATGNFITQCSGLNVFFDCEAPVDSIETIQIADGQLLIRRKIDVQYDSPCISEGFLPKRVYDGIGQDWGDFFQSIDFCNFFGDSFDAYVSKLRCFENSTESFRFVEYPCDTIWTVRGTSVDDIQGNEVMVYPNPANGQIYIENATHKMIYRILNIQGQVIKVGEYTDNGISLLHEGIFLLNLVSDGREWTQRIVNYR